MPGAGIREHPFFAGGMYAGSDQDTGGHRAAEGPRDRMLHRQRRSESILGDPTRLRQILLGI